VYKRQVQIRSGLLLQAQAITGPQEHFGLGTWNETDVARILWPNGVVNAEFALHADQEVLAQQRLKGSCPFLFAWDGKEMRFVKDTVPWGSAIGLRINDLGSARIAATEEWYKIPRQDLVPVSYTHLDVYKRQTSGLVMADSVKESILRRFVPMKSGERAMDQRVIIVRTSSWVRRDWRG